MLLISQLLFVFEQFVKNFTLVLLVEFGTFAAGWSVQAPTAIWVTHFTFVLSRYFTIEPTSEATSPGCSELKIPRRPARFNLLTTSFAGAQISTLVVGAAAAFVVF
jgi:hypothetical protein